MFLYKKYKFIINFLSKLLYEKVDIKKLGYL